MKTPHAFTVTVPTPTPTYSDRKTSMIFTDETEAKHAAGIKHSVETFE